MFGYELEVSWFCVSFGLWNANRLGNLFRMLVRIFVFINGVFCLCDFVLEDDLVVDDLRTEMRLFISSFIMETLLIDVHDELRTFGMIRFALLGIVFARIGLLFTTSTSTSGVLFFLPLLFVAISALMSVRFV